MNVIVNNNENSIEVNISGRMDTINAADFEQAIRPFFNKMDIKITVNCSELTYICSTGLRCFISLLKHTRKNNSQLMIRGVSPNVKEIFDMTGFSSLFEIIQ